MNAPTDDNGFQWRPAPPPEQPPGTLRYLWNHPVVIAGVMGMLLLLVTAVSIIAIKAVGNQPSGSAAGDSPDDQQVTGLVTPGATGTGAASPPAGSQPAGSVPAADSAGAVFLSGKLEISRYDSGVDFDTATKSSSTAESTYDIQITDTALNAATRAQVGVGATALSPQGCSAPTVTWGNAAHISVLGDGATICVRTNDGRLGAFTVAKLEKSTEGRLRRVDVDYVVWKKQGDL